MENRIDRGEKPTVLLVAERLLSPSIDGTVPLFELSAAAGFDLTRRRDIVNRALEKVNRDHGFVFGLGWSCGRRASVVQAQRQIHRAFRAAFTIADTMVPTGAAGPVTRNIKIGDVGSEDHSVHG